MPEAQKTPRVGRCEALCALFRGEAGPLLLLTGLPLFVGLFPPGGRRTKKRQAERPDALLRRALHFCPQCGQFQAVRVDAFLPVKKKR